MQYEYAQTEKRIAGGILDYIVLFFMFWVVSILYALFGLVPDYSGGEVFVVMGIVMFGSAMLIPNPLSLSFGFHMLYIVLFLTEALYYSLMEIFTTKGTLGHRVTGVSIYYRNGEKPTIFIIFLRSCIKALSRYLFLLPFLTIFFTGRSQAVTVK